MDFLQHRGEAFGIFAGTAVNDTSSVTAAASTWDSIYHLGSQTLDKAVTVKLTRTLAIIPITLVLAFLRTKRAEGTDGEKVSLKSVFPFFILFFIGASVITTAATAMGVPAEMFVPLKELSKFFIIMAMGAHWIPYRCSKAYQKWRKADSHGTLLLDRNHDCFSCNAACDASLVKFL